MRLINKLNASPRQKAFLTGNSGQRIIMNLRYLPTQKIWMMDLQLNDFIIRGITVTTSPNMLHNFNRTVPFGMACITLDGQDPRDLTDFDTGYARLYLLNEQEVIEAEAEYFD